MFKKLFLALATATGVAHAQVPVQAIGDFQVIAANGPAVEACSALLASFLASNVPGSNVLHGTINGAARIIAGQTTPVAIVSVQYSTPQGGGTGECWSGFGHVLAAEVILPTARRVTWANGFWS